MNPTRKINIETGELIGVNPGFYQFYKKNFGFIRFLITKNPQAAKVFFFLVENMDSFNALVISQKSLSEALKMGRTNLWKATKYLREQKYLEMYKSGSTNIYCINCQLVWQQSHTRKQFAKFSANVYISDSEQIKTGKTTKIGHFEVKQKSNLKPNTLFDYEL